MHSLIKNDITPDFVIMEEDDKVMKCLSIVLSKAKVK